MYEKGGESRGSHLHSFVSKAGKKKCFLMWNGAGRSQDSRSLRSPATCAHMRRSCQPAGTARESPASRPPAAQNPGLSELGGCEWALGHHRHLRGRGGLPTGHSMAHKFSSQNRTERCSQFSLFGQHFGCFQCGQLRLRANMNRLRIQR